MNSIPQNPNDYVPLGGTSRRYLNRVTGETISRRKYEKLFPPTALPPHDTQGDAHVYRVPKTRAARVRLLRNLERHGYEAVRPVYIDKQGRHGTSHWQELYNDALADMESEFFDDDYAYDDDEVYAPSDLAYFIVF